MVTDMGEPQNTWLIVKEAAARGRCGPKVIYHEIRAGRLRAARVGGRREYRLRPEWIDEWLERTSTPVEVRMGR
jgi:excisionase family DNA binding protein